MEISRVSLVTLLAALATVAHSVSVDELSHRHYQLSMDTFQHFEEQLHSQQTMFEERIRQLESKVTNLENINSPVVLEGRIDNVGVDNVDVDNGGVDNGGVDNGGVDNGGVDNSGVDSSGVDGSGVVSGGVVDIGRGDNGGGDNGGGDIGGGGHVGGSNNGPEPTDAPVKPTTKKPLTTTPPTTTQATTTQATTKKPATTVLRTVPQYEATCAQIYMNGYTTSGDYTIDPDGFGENIPYAVYCDMDQGEGITIVGHDSEEENIAVRGFDSPGSFILEPTYINGVTMRQLGALADASLECEQFVKYNCKSSSLMTVHKKSRLTYAWWVDRYGQKRVNFGGAGTDTQMCACGVTRTCFKDSSTCNCDHPNAKNQMDEGYFTDKDLLPVMTINLGDTGGKRERGAITLGKFKCKG